MLLSHNGKIEFTKFDIGDKVYQAKKTKINLNFGTTIESKEIWVPIINPATVHEINVVLSVTDCNYSYVIINGDNTIKCEKDVLFKSFEEAERFCDTKNRVIKKMRIADIHIPTSFTKTYPSVEKITKKYEEYLKNRRFTDIIVVDKNNVLLDGYITYILSKGFGYQEVDVYVKEEK